jgi:outer membrane protein OmpA-like peptidoglycan-associated protein
MEKHGVNLLLTRQDDTNQMVQDIIKCAQEIHDGSSQCTTGANIIDIMGDQAAEVAAQANPQLKKLGPDYTLKIIGAVGYSRGEDACMLLPSVKANPKSIAQTEMKSADGTVLPVRGVLIAGSIHEGDWNICMKYAGDNAIPNNPDEHTFDQDAFNWMPEPDYNTAAADYNAGKCDDRKEVSKGKLTGRIVHVCINGVATWTPADVTVATDRGGLVKAADSLMYRSQMPSVLIGSGHFMNQNKPEFENLLRASFEGADQIKAYDAALHKAAAIEAVVYHDEGGSGYSGGAYWYHYFHPVSQKDSTGLTVSLGGSAVCNLQDNLILFGFDGNNNNMSAAYSIFRNINLQQYPVLYSPTGPTPLPDAKDVIDRTFIKDIEDAVTNGDQADAGAAADVQDFSKQGSGDVVSQRSYSINFATGSAQPLPESLPTLAAIKDSAAITGLKLRIDGFTDNVGSADSNRVLSESRAQAVRQYLQHAAPKQFPSSRFVAVEGHGQDSPVADNSTAAGKAANRRVSITLVD